MRFLVQFFKTLSSLNIDYCVLRNYESLPNSTNGSDLDILIQKKNLNIFIEIIQKICKDYQGNIVSVIQSEICPRICLLGSSENGWGLMIDLHFDKITYLGHTIISPENIWGNCFITNKNIFALDKKVDSLIGLFKEVLNNGKCEEKYYTNFQNHSCDTNFLKSIFTPINKEELSESLSGYSNKPLSKVVIKDLSILLGSAFPKQRKINKIKKITRLAHQPGYTIAFLGTDGSGKSTIIENIRPYLSDAFHNAVYYEHMRPNRFPSLARLMGKKEEFVGPVTNPHASSASGFLGSLFRWGYYLIDYILGFYLKIWPIKAIRSCVWIFDRYYYDYLIDPKRSRINLPMQILRFGQFLIPKPDIIICLGTNPQTIHNRKPELELSEVVRQVAALKKFCIRNKRAVWIDTGQSIEESSSETLRAIVDYMGNRFKDVSFF